MSATVTLKQEHGVTLFRCVPMSAWVRPEVCLKRQRVAGTKTTIKGAGRKGAVRQNSQASACWMCLDCEHGKKLAEELP